MKIKANIPQGTCIILFSKGRVFRFRHNTVLDVPDEYINDSFKVFIERNKLIVLEEESITEEEPSTESELVVENGESSENIELPKKKRGRRKLDES